MKETVEVIKHETEGAITDEVAQLAKTLQDVLEERANQLARETGFIKRQRVLTGAGFVQTMIFGIQRPDERMDGLVQVLQRRQETLTASALSQRFGRKRPNCWSGSWKN